MTLRTTTPGSRLSPPLHTALTYGAASRTHVGLPLSEAPTETLPLSRGPSRPPRAGAGAAVSPPRPNRAARGGVTNACGRAPAPPVPVPALAAVPHPRTLLPRRRWAWPRRRRWYGAATRSSPTR